MLRFFTRPARLIEIPVGCASPQALHTAKTSYLGTMVPCRDTLPALPLCFSRSEMSRSIVISSQLWMTAYTGLGLEIKRPLSPFRRSVLRMIINPLLGKFEPCCSACSDVSKYLPGIRLTSIIEPSLPATQDDASGNSLYIQQSFHGMYTENNILSAFRQVKPVFHDIYGRVKY
jgi:hypothetical protein